MGTKDYSEYYERLTSYTNWAGDVTIYVKALVESGFVYSGESDTVFCFKCGVAANGWREEDDPIKRHEDLNKNCFFLAERSRNIVGGQEIPRSSLSDFEEKQAVYDWVPGTGTVNRNDREVHYPGITKNVTEDQNAPAEKVNLAGVTFISAVSSGNLKQTKAIFNKSVDINKKYQSGQTALYYAAFKGYADIVQFLLNNGADMMVCDDSGNFPIHTACNKGQVKCVELLIKKGANVNLLTRRNLTPLHFSVCADQYETTKLLINYSANVNTRNKSNVGYLYFACAHGNLQMVELLLQCGAIIDIPGRTVSNSALHVASTKGHYKVISCLLNHGASLVLKDEKFPPLCAAIHSKSLDAFDVLLDAGADPNYMMPGCKQGYLHYFAFIGDFDYMSRLLDHGADINAIDESGRTPLHTASQAGNLKAAECLLSHGADANIRTEIGSTALVVAKSEEIKLLLSKHIAQDQPSSPLHQSNSLDDQLQPTNPAFAPPQSIATAPPLDDLFIREILKPISNLFSEPLETQLQEKEEELVLLKEKTVNVEAEIADLKQRIETQRNQQTEDTTGFSLPTNNLECPICLEIPYAPSKIFQCEQGHIFCEVCKNKGLKFCPECRIELDGKFIRNRRLEAVIQGMTNKPEKTIVY